MSSTPNGNAQPKPRHGSPGIVELLDREFRSWLARAVPDSDTETLQKLFQQALYDPAREFLQRPGKSVRGRLVERTWALAGGGQEEIPEQLPLIVEILHAGSLIIDDIQDGSVRRRGQPALHRLCGVATAINTANLFYSWTLELLGQLPVSDAIKLALYRRASSTLLRCHQGQGMDLTARAYEVPQQDVACVVSASTKLKTGTLMELAAELGAVAASGESTVSNAAAQFGHRLGVGLQMLDDLSGLTCAARSAKGLEDLQLARPTWVWVWLSETCEPQIYQRLQRDGAEVAVGDASAEDLRDELQKLVVEHGRQSVHRGLHGALDRLRAQVEDQRCVDLLAQDVAQLEVAYG